MAVQLQNTTDACEQPNRIAVAMDQMERPLSGIVELSSHRQDLLGSFA